MSEPIIKTAFSKTAVPLKQKKRANN